VTGAATAGGFDSDSMGGQDKLDITAFGITAATFSSQVQLTTAPAGGTLVTIGPDTVRLAAAALSSVSAEDFVLAP
jgi:hypothetical protein